MGSLLRSRRRFCKAVSAIHGLPDISCKSGATGMKLRYMRAECKMRHKNPPVLCPCSKPFFLIIVVWSRYSPNGILTLENESRNEATEMSYVSCACMYTLTLKLFRLLLKSLARNKKKVKNSGKPGLRNSLRSEIGWFW